ncbi:MAG: DUF2975 domain-containing protein [Oscillospiraceae bacterium]|nr:DUF2975 domain-containing protein [Oscillospiraceae bacterium]
MKSSKNLTAVITLWVNRAVALAVGAMLFLLPYVLEWYQEFRWLSETEQLVLSICFYCCAAAIAVALWNVDRMLTDILAGQVFIRKNVKRIQRIQLSCGVVALICIPATVAYMPLIFLVVIMAFLCLMVSVVASVMDAAVTIREENDLTI